jgi:cysteinyl-tRNA synthetase
VYTLTITSTLTGNKESFTPENPPSVLLYVCGITPYDYAHIGHGRCYVTFDVLYRLLHALGYEVTYCRNYTDIDDKLINRSLQEHGVADRYTEIAQRYINAYKEDMAALQCIIPQHEPRVTDNIPEIIAFIQGLIARGHAYVVQGSVYFSITSFPEYGKLSKRSKNDLCAGLRVQINENKQNPLDFALWKSEAERTFWESPWGFGRPGWHIECSTLAKKYLGTPIDIHGGGMDLIFPHHENEIAQSESLDGSPFARYWVHNAFVRINQEKMSKSLGNFFTLRDVFQKFNPMVMRYLFLQHHYRSPLDFSFEDLEVSQKSYQRLAHLFHSVKNTSPLRIDAIAAGSVAHQMLTFLLDDLNTSGMLGVIFENIKYLQNNPNECALVKTILTDLMGLTLIPLPEKLITITPEIQELLNERDQARKTRDWQRSDALRNQLKDLGYEVQDIKLS